MRKFLKQLFCLHRKTKNIRWCDHCGKKFSRRNGWELCGLDLLKVKLSQKFCKHERDYAQIGGATAVSMMCIKCYLPITHWKNKNRLLKFKQFLCFHKGTLDYVHCSKCQKLFTRTYPEWGVLCGLDLLKLKLGQVFCFHKWQPSQFPIGYQLYCSKCDKQRKRIEE